MDKLHAVANVLLEKETIYDEHLDDVLASVIED